MPGTTAAADPEPEKAIHLMAGGTGKTRRRVLVIGLDCATPQLVFGQFRQDLPNISRLIDSSIYGRLQSAIPPITVPAWASMMTGKDAGRLGFYGFRNRSDHSYRQLQTVDSHQLQEPAVWDVVSRAGGKVVTIGVPPSYPPKPVNGIAVGCFLSPSTRAEYTYPANLKYEIADVVGEYITDVGNFRTDEKDRLLGEIYRMTEKRFELARHFMDTHDWDFFMLVEMGTDRIHHGFWHFMDPGHPQYEPGRFTEAIRHYYRAIDQELGTLLERLDDETAVLVVSDHGAQAMQGAIAINDWLIQEGLLRLSTKPQGIAPIEACQIDWNRTVAWASGGYYARIFLNVLGREANGTVGDYDGTLHDLKQRIESIPDDHGRPMGTKVYVPQEQFSVVRGFAPDLIALFGRLSWRAAGSVGHEQIYCFDNDTGPDDANHAEHGIFMLKEDGRSQQVEGHQLMDIAPTLLDIMGLPKPAGIQGRVIGR